MNDIVILVCNSTNLFFINEKQILTQLVTLSNGITRGKVLEICNKLNLNVKK